MRQLPAVFVQPVNGSRPGHGSCGADTLVRRLDSSHCTGNLRRLSVTNEQLVWDGHSCPSLLTLTLLVWDGHSCPSPLMLILLVWDGHSSPSLLTLKLPVWDGHSCSSPLTLSC